VEGDEVAEVVGGALEDLQELPFSKLREFDRGLQAGRSRDWPIGVVPGVSHEGTKRTAIGVVADAWVGSPVGVVGEAPERVAGETSIEGLAGFDPDDMGKVLLLLWGSV
jgi:hypothetical protein